MGKANIGIPPYKAFAVFNGLMTILGLFLLKHDKKANIHKISYIKLIYHLFILAAIVYLAYTQITYFFPKDADQDIVFILVVYYPKTAGHVMTLLLILSFSINSTETIRILNNKSFSSAISKIDQSRLKKSYSRQLFLFAFFTVLYIGTEFFSKGPESNFLFQVLGANDFTVYNVATIAQYSLSMTVSLMLVQFLNENLKKIGDLAMDLKSEREGRISKNKNLEEKELRRTLQIFYMSVNDQEGVKEFVADRTADKEIDILNKILQMRRFYQIIYKTSMAFNKISALRILLLVLHHTIIIIINLYSILRDTMEFSYEKKPSLIFIFVKCLSLSLISILWMIAPTTRLFNEIHTTCYMVQDIITKSASPAIVDEMELFSLQLLQAKISISPYGLFEVANKLMLHLLGLVTTYLVILLQFKVMTDDLKAKNLTLPHERPGDFPRFYYPNRGSRHGSHDGNGPHDESFEPPPPPPPDDDIYQDDSFPSEPHEPPPF